MRLFFSTLIGKGKTLVQQLTCETLLINIALKHVALDQV